MFHHVKRSGFLTSDTALTITSSSLTFTFLLLVQRLTDGFELGPVFWFGGLLGTAAGLLLCWLQRPTMAAMADEIRHSSVVWALLALFYIIMQHWVATLVHGIVFVLCLGVSSWLRRRAARDEQRQEV